jgi:cell division septation protein DedD
MTRLSDTQLVILGAAAQRADLSVLPLPETLKLKGGALTKVMDSLRNRGLIRVIETDGRPQRVVITSEGMAAIGVEREDESQTAAPADANAALDDYPTHGTPADQGAWAARRDDMARNSEAGAMVPDTAPTSAEAGSAADASAPATKADGAATKAKRKAKAKAAKPATTPPAEKPTPRTGTKQALMIEMLKRPEGATVEQIAAATGWQHHTIRGAISGALKKKLGLTVEATRTREVGPNKTGAKGSSTVYRITGSSPVAG